MPSKARSVITTYSPVPLSGGVQLKSTLLLLLFASPDALETKKVACEDVMTSTPEFKFPMRNFPDPTFSTRY